MNTNTPKRKRITLINEKPQKRQRNMEDILNEQILICVLCHIFQEHIVQKGKYFRSWLIRATPWLFSLSKRLSNKMEIQQAWGTDFVRTKNDTLRQNFPFYDRAIKHSNYAVSTNFQDMGSYTLASPWQLHGKIMSGELCFDCVFVQYELNKLPAKCPSCSKVFATPPFLCFFIKDHEEYIPFNSDREEDTETTEEIEEIEEM